MSSPGFEPRRFRTTVPFYARYRLSYPHALMARVAAFVGLKAGDPVLDLGCGPGLLAVPLAKMGFAVTAVDPEPEMVEACLAAARAAGVAVDVRRGSSFEMPAGIGPFRLVTIGRAFHWMDREAALEMLDDLVTGDGALTFFGDDHPQTAENAWRRVLRDLGDTYGRQDSPHVRRAAMPGYRTKESLLFESAFPRLSGMSEFIRRAITADEIVGLGFSLSTTSPEKLGERAAAFETELRDALTALSPDGRFIEIAELGATVARRA